MTQPELTQQQVRTALHYDFHTGQFTWKHNGRPAGYLQNGYTG